MPVNATPYHRKQFMTLLLSNLCFLCLCARADLWVTGYYPGYQQGVMAATNIDFTTITHVVHFALVPNSDGSLNSGANSITPSQATNLVSLAHAANRKAIICVGGANSQPGFQGATIPAHLPAFISNLTNFMAAYGYDGIDLDWEPLPATDANQYTNLVNGLRAALNGFTQHMLLTVAAAAYPADGDPPNSEATMFASLQNQFDQINIMTYDLSGPYGGWITWFNSPIYDGSIMFPNTTRLVPSIDGSVSTFISNGVAPAKLGIGTPFYGYIWTHGPGMTAPRQAWPTNNVPTVSTPTYATVLNTYFQSNLYHWDTNAQAAYLSITNTPSSNDIFLSYDNPVSCQAKISYARNRRLGGLMIWELTQDYFPAQPGGQRTPLVQAIKQGLATPRFSSIQFDGQSIQLSFDSLPLGLYRVQWASNASGGAWSTLSNNVPGTGNPLQITDTNTPQAQRFYRIQTPP
jgi:chitinase